MAVHAAPGLAVPAARPGLASPRAGIRSPLGACALMSVALHCGLYWLPKGAPQPGQGIDPSSRAAPVMRVRVEPPPLSFARPAHGAAVSKQRQALAPAAPAATQPAATAREARAMPPPTQAQAEPPAAPETTEVTQPIDRPGIEYLPHHLLSVVPVPEKPLTIPYPQQGPVVGRFSTEMSLFIDEEGMVQRVRMDGQPLPAALEDAARQAFLGARWQPGQADGHAVKSLLRVEVTFASTSLAQVGVIER